MLTLATDRLPISSSVWELTVCGTRLREATVSQSCAS